MYIQALFSVIISTCFLLGSNGIPIEGEDEVDTFLKKYHYLGHMVPDPRVAELAERNMTRARQVAISMFQMKFGIPVTGVADSQTLEMMRKPRCGMPDINTMQDMPDVSNMMDRRYHGELRSSEGDIADNYVLQGSKWEKTSLTYKIVRYCADLSREEVDKTIAQAFQIWADVTPLSFTAVTFYDPADIVIQFKGYYDRGYDFDGRGRALAYAYFPQYGGDAYFDDAELWTIDSYDGTNLLQVAAHEFGHALGLHHSYDYTALMFPSWLGYIPNYQLPYDDLIGIQSIYGPPETPRVTDPPETNPPTRGPVPSFPPGETPDVCYDAVFDAITTLKIGDEPVTIVFREDYYYAIDRDGLMEGYPRKIKSDWYGLDVDHIDAAFTPPWERINGQWRYMEVTYLFSGDYYYRVENMRVDGAPRLIADDFGINGNLDAIFQLYTDGKYYAIKGEKVYRFSSRDQGAPDYGYPQPITTLNHRLYKVDAAFVGIDGLTYFFEHNQHVRFMPETFEIQEGYPKHNGVELLKCK